MLNSGIELHDSEIAAITQRAGDVVIHFCAAYIHKSEGSPGWDAGSGWIQAAELMFREAVLPVVTTELPADIGNGELSLGEQTLSNWVPIPLDYVGQAGLTFMFGSTGEQFRVEGSGVTLQLLGVAEYVEEFSGNASTEAV